MLERIKDEFAELSNNPNANCGFTVGLVDDNLILIGKLLYLDLKILLIKMDYFF